MALGSAGSGLLALPMLSDGMNFDWPQYYETIQTASRLTCHTVQSADLDGDGQDELICRGPAGINLTWATLSGVSGGTCFWLGGLASAGREVAH